MKRRDFLKFGTAGLAVVAVGTMADWPLVWRGSKAYASSLGGSHLTLDMVERDAEMVDGIRVPMWAYMLTDDNHGAALMAARIPGPVLVALEGDRIELHITNHITTGGAHGFAIPGVPLRVDDATVDQVTIPPGNNEVRIEFTAPAAGTYMYLDPLNAPVNRTMGLHGVLVVLPNPVGNNTPYSTPTPSVQRLFNDLGTAAHFPGAPWDQARNAIWVFNCIDPVKAAAATASGAAIAPATFLGGFLPQYFTINGKSGFFSAQHGNGDEGGAGGHEHASGLENTLLIGEGLFDPQGSVSIHGRVGQPIVIRTLNAGLMWQSPHIHGNHVYNLSDANINGSRQILSNLTMVDTWAMAPGDIKDVLHAYIAPPDIPANFWEAANAGTNQEVFPLLYPMHDHNEISNTAAGGNYPQGAATHWQIDGPFDPTDPALGVILIDRADLRVKTGQLLIEGRFSVPGVMLDIHAGVGNGPSIARNVQVDGNGRFRYRGRALKALASRFVTMMHHEPTSPSVVHATRTIPLRLL